MSEESDRNAIREAMLNKEKEPEPKHGLWNALVEASHVETIGDAIWRTALLLAMVGLFVMAILTFNRSGSSSDKSAEAANDAAAARLAAEAAQQVLDGQQAVVNRSGCVSDIYGRYFLAIADVIINGSRDEESAQAMVESRTEIQDLLDDEACPIPDLHEEVGNQDEGG